MENRVVRVEGNRSTAMLLLLIISRLLDIAIAATFDLLHLLTASSARCNISIGTTTTSSDDSRGRRRQQVRQRERENLESIVVLSALPLQGRLVFGSSVPREASSDFGMLAARPPPRAVLHPACVQDISILLKAVAHHNNSILPPHLRRRSSCVDYHDHAIPSVIASNSEWYDHNMMRVAARGHGHSIHGQAQAGPHGVVVEMSALRGIHVEMAAGGAAPYVDARGGELWIDVLYAALQHGLAPRSWTDYLHLTVGGTLSNAGISGQAFLHGPQVCNVYQLEVVTGTGDVVLCSKDENSDLFFATLGGLGQFGIITSARIALEPAPDRVKWVRALYSDFETFRRDQEYLISQPDGSSFDYLEGFVVPWSSRESLIDNWRSALFKPQHPKTSDSLSVEFGPHHADHHPQVLYYLEVAKNYNILDEADTIDEKLADLLSPLECIAASVHSTDVSYLDFLNRVHTGELKLRAKGLWDIPHPWLNLFVPRSRISEFNAKVFMEMLSGKKGGGPIIIYPMNRNKWEARMSVAFPDEDVFYLVALLRCSSGLPGDPTKEELLEQNQAILEACKGCGVKQYLPSFSSTAQWRRQYGRAKWASFVRNKATFDPQAILAPGQNIFHRPLHPVDTPAARPPRRC